MFSPIKTAVIFLVALVASSISGSFYTTNSEKNESFVETRGISSNYKLADESTINFPSGSNSLNSLLITFQAEKSPAEVVVRYCENEVFNRTVSTVESLLIPLTCKDQQISIKKSPFAGVSINWKFAGPLFGRPLPPLINILVVAVFLTLINLICLRKAGSAAAVLLPLTLTALYGVGDISRENSLCMWALVALCLMLGWRSESVSSLRPYVLKHWMLIAGFGLALVIRCYGIQFGLPDQYHPDERWKVSAIRGMEKRDSFNPKYFFHPTQLLYLTMEVHQLVKKLGLFTDSDADIIVSGRLVSALAGAGTVPVAMLVATAIGVSPVIVGTLTLALPLHVTASRYLKEDALLTFWVTTAFLFCLYFSQSSTKRNRYLLLCALSSGFAAGSKYSGVVCLLMLLPILLVSAKETLRARLLILGGFLLLFSVGFFISCPFALLDTPAFLQGLAYEHKHMSSGHTVPVSPWHQLWMYHFWRSIVPSFGYVSIASALLASGGLLGGFFAEKMRLRFLNDSVY